MLSSTWPPRCDLNPPSGTNIAPFMGTSTWLRDAVKRMAAQARFEPTQWHEHLSLFKDADGSNLSRDQGSWQSQEHDARSSLSSVKRIMSMSELQGNLEAKPSNKRLFSRVSTFSGSAQIPKSGRRGRRSSAECVESHVFVKGVSRQDSVDASSVPAAPRVSRFARVLSVKR